MEVMEDLEPLKVSSPLYLMTVSINCYSCGKEVNVSTIATKNLVDPESDDPSALEGEICLLTQIEELPAEIAAVVEEKQPRYSRTADLEYLMTVCECGAHQGDHYVSKALFNAACYEPDTIRVVKLPVEGNWELCCGYSSSSAYETLIDEAS